jgi:hypothetical protein
MKLFIVNKDDFDNDFPSSQKIIHRKAFNLLMQSIGFDERIPKVIDFDFEMSKLQFTFLSEKNDVYFYEYKLL